MPTAPPLPGSAEYNAIAQAAATYNVPLPFSLGIAASESSFAQTDSTGATLTSKDKSGKPIAYGVYQLTPDTAAGLGVDATDEKQNIIGGNKYLGELLSQYGGNEAAAAAAYNAGPGRVSQFGTDVSTWPSWLQETKNYVPEVTDYAKQYADAPLQNALRNSGPAFLGAPGSTKGVGTASDPVGSAVKGVVGGAASATVTALFAQLTADGFTEKMTQFFVVMLLIIGGFMILSGAAHA